MTRQQTLMIAAGGSLALLLGAWAFQYIGGLAPCKLCLWQRYPHGVAVVAGIFAIAMSGRLWPLIGMFAALTTAGIGIYHTGVERTWWEGPTTCTSGSVAGVSADDLLNQIMNAPLVRCDEVAWAMLGVSMASWNAIISLGLAAIWVMAMRRSA